MFEVADYDKSGNFYEGLAVFVEKVGDKYLSGYRNKIGAVVIEPKFGNATDFHNGVAFAYSAEQNGTLVLINKSGDILKKFDPEIRLRDYGWEDRYMYRSDWVEIYKPVPKRTLIDKNPGAQFPSVIQLTGIDHSDSKSKLFGFVNRSGKIVVPCEYDDVMSFSEGFAAVKINGLWGYVDTTGSVIIKPSFDYVGSFSQGRAVVFKNKRAGIIDSSGKFVLKPSYTRIYNFSCGLAGFVSKMKFGFLDRDGRVVIPPKFDQVLPFSENRACVKVGERWGFIDRTGSIVTKPSYYLVSSFGDGVAAVATNSYSEDSRLVKASKLASSSLSYQWTPVDPGEKILLRDFVRPKLRFELIDKNGNNISRSIFEDVLGFFDGVAKVRKDGKFSFLSLRGRKFGGEYAATKEFHDGICLVSDKRDWWYCEELTDVGDPIIDLNSHLHRLTLRGDPVRLKQILDTTSEVIDKFPGSANAYGNRARVLFLMRRYKESVRDYSRAIELRPDCIDFLKGRAFANLNSKNWSSAESDFENIHTIVRSQVNGGAILAHNISETYSALSYCLLRQGKKKKFERTCTYKTFLELSGKSPGNALHACTVPKEYKNTFIEYFEGVGNCDVVSGILLNNGISSSDYRIDYPKTESQLEEAFVMSKKELELARLNYNSKGSKLDKLMYRYRLTSCCNSVVDLAKCKRARFKANEEESLLKFLCELCEELDSSNGKHDFFGYSNEGYLALRGAKLSLARFYLKQHDPRCNSIYQELFQKMPRDALVPLEYCCFLAKFDRLEEARQYFGNIDEHCPNAALGARLLRKFGEDEKADRVIARSKQRKRRQGKSLRVFHNNYPDIDDDLKSLKYEPGFSLLGNAPVPQGDLDAQGYYELSRTCNELRLESAGKYYIDLAIKESQAKNSEDTAKYQTYRKSHFSKDNVSAKVNGCISRGQDTYPHAIQSLLGEDLYGRFSKETLEYCIKTEPEWTMPYVELMALSISSLDYEEAENVFHRVTAINPDCLEAWVQAGLLYNDQGKYDKAKAAFLKVRKLDPENQLAKVMLSKLSDRRP